MEIAAESLDGAAIFHAVTEISGFVLYMHQQIPSPLQDITKEFDSLCTQYNDLESARRENQAAPSLRRKHAGEMREAKRGIRRFQKLMSQVSSFQSALKLVIGEVRRFQDAVLVVGASPLRPHHVYELSFSTENAAVRGGVGEIDFGKSDAAKVLCKKAIRAMIGKGVGCDDDGYNSGPSKLFLFVKAPASLNLPLHFLPKRDFRCSNKIVPLSLKIKSKMRGQKMDGVCSESGSCDAQDDFIWFQCRHVIKGLASNTPTEGE